MTSKRTRQIALVGVSAGLMFVSALTHAEPIPDVVFSVGTTSVDTNGRDWAYILWQSQDQALIVGQTFAVYGKAGDTTSTNAYTRRAVTGVHTDPLVIEALLGRSEHLGDDLTALEERIDTLFLALVPDPGMALPEKLSAVIRGSLEDPRHLANLIMLGRLHPGVNLCIGYAHAERLSSSGATSFEIREHSVLKAADGAVIGRVTVNAGTPVVLPAPGAPVQVPEFDARGDLNVKLRWSTDKALRRLSLLTYGFNVYRMDAAYALAGGYDLTPPAHSNIAALALSTSAVRRVNSLPVLKTKDFTAIDVADFGSDPSTHFVADDNQRYRSGGSAFEDGAQYYYFISATDILLRNGHVSTGGIVTVCDRLPPDAPSGLIVENDYAYDTSTLTNRQQLKITWATATNGLSEPITHYYVYRWTNMSDIQVAAGHPTLNRIAGPIPAHPSSNTLSYVDAGAGAPQMPQNAGETYWYTVRGEDGSACGGNLSAHSAPAFGVLRDRSGPGAPTGTVSIICCRPTAAFVRDDEVTVSGPLDSSRAYFQFRCIRRSRGVAYADLFAREVAPSNRITRLYFPGDTNVVQVAFDLPRVPLGNGVRFHCVTGSTDGRRSSPGTRLSLGLPPTNSVLRLDFEGDILCSPVEYTGADDDLCRSHYTQAPGGSPTNNSIILNVDLTPGTKEYRIYCSLGFGEPTLIAQGAGDADTLASITITNTTMPYHSGRLCYYAQLLDEHGNASPLSLIAGTCVPFIGAVPRPLLSPLEPAGNAAQPKARLRWFCPPYGVERFQVWVAVDGVSQMPADISDDLSSALGAATVGLPFEHDEIIKTNDFRAYETPRIGPGFGDGAEFEVEICVATGRTYYAFIKPVGTDGSAADDSRNSEVEDHLWSQSLNLGPLVPWPARPLPAVGSTFAPAIRPYRTPTVYHDGVGILVGEFDVLLNDSNSPPYVIHSSNNPTGYIYTNGLGQSLFPIVAYRYEVPSATVPIVSGDLVQVTPLMNEIAYDVFTPIQGPDQARIYDPFVGVWNLGKTSSQGEIYLLDTQALVLGSTYRYLLVRLKENGEIDEVIRTAPVLITP